MIEAPYIAHLVDDEKFIDMAYREFEAVAPNTNEFIVLGEERELKYVKRAVVRFLSLRRAVDFVRSEKCAAVVFHSLSGHYAPLLRRVPANKRIFWIGWGYDYYRRLLDKAYPAGLHMAKTQELESSAPKPNMTSLILSKSKSLAKHLLGLSNTYSQRLLSRIDYFSPVLDVEYELVRKHNRWFRGSYISWNYGTLEDDMLAANGKVDELGNSILVGNSSSFENNHLEIFDTLDRVIDTAGSSIITPLSYGNQWYKEQVISRGREMFGEQFVPLVDFLAKDKYIDLLQSCGHVFFNHVRQQGVGNICVMMLKGAQIYLNSQNPLYSWLRSRGAIVQSIDAFSRTKEGGRKRLEPLSETERAINREVVRKHWARDVQRARTKALVDIALGERARPS